jgi:hypothetical protein
MSVVPFLNLKVAGLEVGLLTIAPIIQTTVPAKVAVATFLDAELCPVGITAQISVPCIGL